MDRNTTVIDAAQQLTLGHLETALQYGFGILLVIFIVMFITMMLTPPRF